MNFSEPFVRRPIATMLLTIAVALLGVVAYWQLADRFVAACSNARRLQSLPRCRARAPTLSRLRCLRRSSVSWG